MAVFLRVVGLTLWAAISTISPSGRVNSSSSDPGARAEGKFKQKPVVDISSNEN